VQEFRQEDWRTGVWAAGSSASGGELATLERWYTGNGIEGSAPKRWRTSAPEAHPSPTDGWRAPPAENPSLRRQRAVGLCSLEWHITEALCRMHGRPRQSFARA